MRAVLMFIPLAACTPDVVPGSYLCGPEELCPDGQACNGTEDRDNGLVAESCVLPSIAKPFVCKPAGTDVEPDDTIDQAQQLSLVCVSPVFSTSDCMLESDDADWISFVPPTTCSAVAVEARLTFPMAYEVLGLELWDADHDMKIGTDKECSSGGDDSGSIYRCLSVELVPGTKYGLKVTPTGEGACGGNCAYNRYSLRVQLFTPG